MDLQDQLKDDKDAQVAEHEFTPTFLGSAIELTCIYADGPNRDGGHVQGNNYSFQ